MDMPGEDTASPPVPFHHIINDKAKSFIALQELQNEVGALLEFRDVVMETFPQLRGKLASRGRWEPGIRVRKKPREETGVSQPRSRSNSRSKAGSSGTSAVQDSGFCTESKKTTDQEAEDELWNLLDLIHTKGTKLRLEVESLQDKYQNARRSRSLSDIPGESHEELQLQIQGLHREKDLLLDRVTEMEAENLANLAQSNQLLAKLGVLAAEKRDLEDQLRAAISAKTELNSRIHDLHIQFIGKQKLVKTPSKTSQLGFTPVRSELMERLRDVSLTGGRQLDFNLEESPRPVDPVSQRLGEETPKNCDAPLTRLAEPLMSSAEIHTDRVKCVASDDRHRTKLGTLDGVVSTPKIKMPCAKGVTPDKEKTAAILKETNVLELQRHLITTTYENQVVQHRLGRLTKCKNNLAQQLDKVREENEDLRFQLEEKSIELEGTRARVRLLERLQGSKERSEGVEGPEQCSSSTESAHHDESPGRKAQQRPPSRIPLKAAKGGSRPVSGQGNSLRPRARKSSESSFNSTSSSPSIRTPPPPPSSHLAKKPSRPPPSVQRESRVAESEPKVWAKREEAVYMDSLEKEKLQDSTQEMNRSWHSALAPKTWQHSLEYFDSINSNSRTHEVNSLNDGREALAECDSLDQMTSDMV